MNSLSLTPDLPNIFQSFGVNVDWLAKLAPDLLWITIGVVGLVVGGAALVLHYHWFRFGFGERTVVFVQILYTLVVVVGFIIMIGSAVYYGQIAA